MANEIYKPYLGSGQVYARIAGTATAQLPIGNCSMFEPSLKEDKQTLKDYTKPGGGSYTSIARIDTVTLKMRLHDLNKTNVARAVFGSDSTITGAVVVDEVVTCYKGGLTPLTHINPTALVVKNSAGTTTYVAGLDYEVKGGGILVLAAGNITDAQSAKLSYSFGDYNKIEGMTTGSVILDMHFEGLNEADSGKPVVGDFFRVMLSPTKAMSLLGDKLSDLEVEGEVLKDPTKTGVGISQYMRIKLV